MGRLAALAVVVCAASPAWAQLSEPVQIRLTWENDLFAGTDGHYTNGTALTVSGRLDHDSSRRSGWEVTLGQQIYTPRDTDARQLVSNDRPYAGFAYLSLGAARWDHDRQVEDRIVLTLGVVGPSSGGQVAYDLVHDLTGSSPAEGWAHQLQDEPAVGLLYRRSSRIFRSHVRGVDADLTADLEVALGNVTTHAGVGTRLRLGLNVPDEYSEPSPAALRCYLTAGARVRAVAYDIFLDGNLLRSGGHRVRKHPLVAELQVGLTVAVSDRVSISYVHTYRTPQLQGQRRGDQFGSLSVVISW